MSLNIVFMGTPEFSIPTLDLLIQNKFNIVKVFNLVPYEIWKSKKKLSTTLNQQVLSH